VAKVGVKAGEQRLREAIAGDESALESFEFSKAVTSAPACSESPPITGTSEEIRQAVDNFAAFLKVLWEWDLREQREATDGGDGPRERVGSEEGRE
jgi:hypothetical protein